MNKRLAVLNNYSFSRVTREVEQGLKPSHHLFGIDALKKMGYQIICIDPDKERVWYKIGRCMAKIPFLNFGDLGIQIEALRRRSEYDMIYAPCQDVSILLGLLSYFGLFKKKIIAVAHHPFLKGRLGSLRKYSLYFSLKGHSTFAALSTKVANEINLITNEKNSICLHWGPDLNYYDSVIVNLQGKSKLSRKIDVLAIGRTGRDNGTLIKAFNKTNVLLDIYTSEDVQEQSYGSNIRIHKLEDPEQLKYNDIVALCMSSKLLAVPMFSSESLSGLTSVADALAMGMPVIITENKFIEIDIEGEGIGYWVKEFDAKAWHDKVVFFLESPDSREAAGKKARSLAKDRFNNELYVSELLRLLNTNES